MSHVVGDSRAGTLARELFDAAVRRVQADRLLESAAIADEARRPLSSYETVRVAGMGKAAMAMAGVLEDRHPDRVDEGVVVVPEGYPAAYPERLPSPSTVRVMEGGHPLPSDGSVRAGRRLLDQARATGEEDLVLVLVSGGGTALASLPVEDVDLQDLKATYHQLLTAGVPIHPANVVRKHLTQVGGGQLAQAAQPGEGCGLVVSDVVGNDTSVIASGPTVPDPSTYAEAVEVLYRHGLWREVPEAVRDHVAAGARGRRPETPTADAACFERVRTRLVGTNETALEAVRRAAAERGYRVASVTSGGEGEARVVGREHAETMCAGSVEEPTCWVWGGEPTVTVTGEGRGGRNQEVALGAALALEGHSGDAVFLSGGTDGIDGPTDAAGAWVTSETAERARAAGHDPAAYLDENDAYAFFEAVGGLLRTGPTHTNVMDVHVGLVHPS